MLAATQRTLCLVAYYRDGKVLTDLLPVVGYAARKKGYHPLVLTQEGTAVVAATWDALKRVYGEVVRYQIVPTDWPSADDLSRLEKHLYALVQNLPPVKVTVVRGRAA